MEAASPKEEKAGLQAGLVVTAALASVVEEWKPFRNALSKSEERKMFDEMWDLAKFYI